MESTAQLFRFEEVRQEKGLSIDEFAKVCNISYSFAAALLRGDKTPSIEKVQDIANALGIGIKDLFSSQNNEKYWKERCLAAEEFLSLLNTKNLLYNARQAQSRWESIYLRVEV